MGRFENSLFSAVVLYDSTIKKRVYPFLIDPVIPVADDDVYVITVVGDRLDSLAYQYYSDSTLWWIITAANPELRKDSVFLDAGMQLRIPVSAGTIISLLNDANSSR